MKLVRFGDRGRERPGILLDSSTILDVRAMAFDIEDYNGHFFSTFGVERLAGLLRDPQPKTVSADNVRLAPPIAPPQKIICLGKNYEAHAKEFDAEIPDTPVLFSKAVSAMSGPNDPIVLPATSKTVDAEVELAVVIGRRTRGIAKERAVERVAGYTILNDVTDRDAQRAGKQWFKGKGADTFCPMGPYLATPDEIADPQSLDLYSKVNGATLQESNTAHMLFKIAHLIAFISETITLEAGDVIATGTPGGIGSARKPPVLLKAGDTVELGIDKLGAQVCKVEQARL